MQTDVMNRLRWMRIVGDTVFAAGALTLGWFVQGLVTGRSFDTHGRVRAGGSAVVPAEERAGEERAWAPLRKSSLEPGKGS
jgi:nitric oxide reductase subunit B